MKEIFKNVREKLTSKYLKNDNPKEIFRNVREQLVSKYLKSDKSKRYFKKAKKFKPRIKARIRKNKQIINKNIKDFFGWVKGAELVELKECNIEEDPVRPELDVTFRRSY